LKIMKKKTSYYWNNEKVTVHNLIKRI